MEGVGLDDAVEGVEADPRFGFHGAVTADAVAIEEGPDVPRKVGVLPQAVGPLRRRGREEEGRDEVASLEQHGGSLLVAVKRTR